ncbi:MAG: tetratricopeptide repeat protein [Holosporales bacterium]|jgi:TPR repeat protein
MSIHRALMILVLGIALTGCETIVPPGYGTAPSLATRGINFLYGRDGYPQNVGYANYWLKQAAEKGDMLAQYHWAVNNELGIGVPQDFRAAAKWYEHAAVAGHPLAQNNLAMLYYHGLGVVRNLEISVYWFGRAALQGQLDSAENVDFIDRELTTRLQSIVDANAPMQLMNTVYGNNTIQPSAAVSALNDPLKIKPETKKKKAKKKKKTVAKKAPQP